MKRIVFLFLGFMIAFYSQGQGGRQVSQLATFGKVWGFLKYYHLSGLKGKPDWDKELLRMIPLVEQAHTRKQFFNLMQDWYHSLPSPALAVMPVNWNTDSTTRIFSEKDIQQFDVPGPLRKEFLQLYDHHVPDTNRYATRYYGNHLYDHIIHTEDDHGELAYPSRELRLLALFRYWNTIEFFYPHKQRILNWNRVLNRYIERFLLAKDSTQYRYAVRELIHELPDSHSFMQQPGDVYYFYPFRLDYIEGKYVIAQCNPMIAQDNDYRLGDEISMVNGKSTSAREKELLKITTGTNHLSLYRNIAQELLKTGDSVVQVTFSRKGRSFTKKVELHTWPIYSKMLREAAQPWWQSLGNGIWYVRFCNITSPDTLKTLFRDINDAKAVIWDMRDYPNYQVTTALYQYLFPSQTQLTEERNASAFFPGLFVRSRYYFTPAAGPSIAPYTGHLIVLVDEHTQSLSESIAAILRLRPNTTVMGRQTAGTTGNISWLNLPGNIAVSYTGVGVTGVGQSFMQGEGVKIDLPVRLTVTELSNSRDFILERAVQYAQEKLLK